MKIIYFVFLFFFCFVLFLHKDAINNNPAIMNSNLDIKSYPPIKKVELNGKTSSDIASHISNYFNNVDRVTITHENTHEVNNLLKNKYANSGQYAFYLLNNDFIILNQPNTTLEKVANSVPNSLKGMSFNLYLISQRKDWNTAPLNLIDEWLAYMYGSMTRKELGIQDRSETVEQMMDFDFYVISMLKLSPNDEKLKEFVRWNLERSIKIYKESNIQKDCLYDFKNSELLQFTREYFGKAWTKKTFGI